MAWEEIGENIGDKIYKLEKTIEDLRENSYNTQYNHQESYGLDIMSETDSPDSTSSFSAILRGPVTLQANPQTRIHNEAYDGSTLNDSIIASGPYIIVKPKTTENPITIKWILSAMHDGQIVVLEPFYKWAGNSNTTVYSLQLQTGGNINISSNITVSRNEKIMLQWTENVPYYSGSTLHSSSTSGSWTVLSSPQSTVSSSWVGTATSQLNMGAFSIVGAWEGQTTTLGLESHLDMNTYNIKDVDQILLGTSTNSGDILPDDKYGFEADGGTSPTGIRYNVPSSKLHKFYVDGNIEFSIGSSNLDLQDQSGNRKKIINLDTPTTNYDAATKLYVDQNTGGGVTNPVNTTLSLGGNQIQRVTTIFLDGDVNNANSIAGNTGGLDYNVDNTDEYHDFKVDGNTKVRINNNMTLSYETLDLQDNMIQNVSKLWLNGSTANDMFLEPDGTGNTLIYNVPTSHKHRFDINNSMALQVSNTYVTATNNLSVILNAEVAGLTIMNGGGLLSASGTGQESIRSASSTYKVGYHVSNSTSIGSDGSMGIPYKVFSGTVSLLLDSFFGTKDGSIGLVKNNSTGNVYFVARAGSSTWKYEQMA